MARILSQPCFAPAGLALMLWLLLNSGVTATEKRPPQLTVDVSDGVALQQAMDQLIATGGAIRIHSPVELTCREQESVVAGEVSRHALLIPAGVDLDLNGSTLLLDLRSNAHGVRLSSRSAIRNGLIRVIRSENKGSQAIWHAGIGIGAAYDDGGTPQKPGHFSKVSDWKIENITIDQPFPAAAIQIMSEACHGVIRGVRILDSPNALLGIGLDWGSVGKMTSADDQIPGMRALWEKQEIYTTHPHDILIEDIDIGHLTRNVDTNDAGIRCSACYNIRIRNVHIASAASAVAIFGGDCGFEFAPRELEPLAHTGYRIENVVIGNSFRCGIVLNGLADNVYRSTLSHQYQPRIDPARPGLHGIIVSDSQFRCESAPPSQGMFITAVSGAHVHNVLVSGFDIGVRVKDWIDGLHFRHVDLSRNNQPQSVSDVTATPDGVVFE